MKKTLRDPGSLALVVDMAGCPNRCLHCWLGHMPNRTMEPGADDWIVEQFRPYFQKITFYSWLREPDFCPDYRARWEKDKRLSVGARPERFELVSFWRLVRDADYVRFLKEVGVGCVQLTFFGMEETTDRYVGRRGAFRELLQATELLLQNGIRPRWQGFLNEENRFELVRLLRLAEELALTRRCEEAGGLFRFFVHEGSCDGENRRLYPIRILKEHIPPELIPYYLDYETICTEQELCERWRDEAAPVELHTGEELVLNISNTYDVFYNFTHMTPEWRIGNLKTDPIEELVRSAVEEDTPALRTARAVSLGELARRYGDAASHRVFAPDDYRRWLLNRYLETEWTGK